MKYLLTHIILLLHLVSIGQTISKERSKIDSIVTSIDEDKSLVIDTSSQQLNNRERIIAKYYCYTKSKKIAKVVREYADANSIVKHYFYFKNTDLLFCRQLVSTICYDADRKDTITWRGSFYFKGYDLFDYETLGIGKSELDNWNPALDILNSLVDTMKALKQEESDDN